MLLSRASVVPTTPAHGQLLADAAALRFRRTTTKTEPTAIVAAIEKSESIGTSLVIPVIY